MLIPGFYSIEKLSQSEYHVEATIILNPNHEVYSGHFPEQAVVPGVIQLQIIRELMEKVTNKKLLLSEMGFAKFLNAILPTKSPLLNFSIDFQEIENQIKISATIKDEKLVYTKMKARLSFTH